MRRRVAHSLTCIDHVRIFHVLQLIVSFIIRVLFHPFIFSTRHLLNASAQFLGIVRTVGVLRFYLRKVAIIHRIGQSCACGGFRSRDEFFQSFLLVFHQGIERIEEESLYLSRQCVLRKVVYQRNHKTFGLTRPRTCSNDNRLGFVVRCPLVQQHIPAFALVLVRWICCCPQFPHQCLCLLCLFGSNGDIGVHTLHYGHRILGCKQLANECLHLLDIRALTLVC